MEITARLTGDAKINTLSGDRQVVNFSVAINDSYRVKGKDEPVKVVTYIQCDYWVNPGIASYLTKGKLVELQGRIGVNAYKANDGEPKAALTFHVNTIKLHGNAAAKNTQSETEQTAEPLATTDDLPF